MSRSLNSREHDESPDRIPKEIEETIFDIRQSHADIEAGQVRPVAEAFLEVRKRLGVETN